ncbi:alginate export family protein [Marinifilum sp. D737]|uniref:alginate export family protein n=1 Tax=Marinifilum sp. D737 TaxID=2969628 RepID=UPI002275F020|nr:alginate export family protein [Marinifilum sp. D737]MCY1633098.1 alginate export family protein [Marinifilum sp. D737]
MKKLFRLFLVLFLGLVPSIVMAQLTFTGEIRPRTEYRHGLKSLFNSPDEAAFFTSQRTRLNLGYTQEKFRVGLSVQDVRVWGDVAQLNLSDKNQLMLHEAWGELIFNKNFSLKVGRQELVYDDSRILGNVGWAQQARSHDLALFKFKTDEKGKFHVGFAVNNVGETTVRVPYIGTYKHMEFAWYNRKSEQFDFSLLFMNVGREITGFDGDDVDFEDNSVQTFGTHMNYRPGKIALTGSLYAQTGKFPTDNDISAYMFNLGMKFPVADNWKGNVGIEMLSGTDYDATSKTRLDEDYKSFTPLFGTNHKFNGHMDYFYVGNHTGNVGLTDIYGGLNHSKGQWSFATAIHVFSTAADLYLGTEKQDKYLGTELDLSVAYKYSKSVLVKAGYSHMFASDSMEALKGGDKDETQNWGWVMLVFKPNFLKK